MTQRVALLSLVLAAACACGGKQKTAPAPVAAASEEQPCCVDDRWEAPPPSLGQTPPAERAPDSAVEAFEPE